MMSVPGGKTAPAHRAKSQFERTIDKPGVIHFTIYFAKHTCGRNFAREKAHHLMGAWMVQCGSGPCKGIFVVANTCDKPNRCNFYGGQLCTGGTGVHGVVARRLAAGRCVLVLVLVDTVAFVVLVVDAKKMDQCP
jgi:hypothetical protein